MVRSPGFAFLRRWLRRLKLVPTFRRLVFLLRLLPDPAFVPVRLARLLFSLLRLFQLFSLLHVPPFAFLRLHFFFLVLLHQLRVRVELRPQPNVCRFLFSFLWLLFFLFFSIRLPRPLRIVLGLLLFLLLLKPALFLFLLALLQCLLARLDAPFKVPQFGLACCF